MRRKSFWTLGLVACLGLAIAGFADHKGVPHGKKDGDGGGGKVSLVGHFRDEPGNFPALPDRIMSDCQGGEACPYIDGEEGIDLVISGNGGFRLDINSTGRRGIRNFILNFSDCVSDPVCRPPFGEALVGTDVGSYAILNVIRGVGELGVGRSANLNARVTVRDVFDPNGGELETWFLEFRTFDDPDNICFDSGSGPLVVRHPGADTWEIEAGTTNLACLRSRASKPGGDSSIEFHGTYEMPFKLTLTRKP